MCVCVYMCVCVFVCVYVGRGGVCVHAACPIMCLLGEADLFALF